MPRCSQSAMPLLPSTSIAADPVRQFSVFAENRVGRLSDLIARLQANEVHVMAITVIDTIDSAIIPESDRLGREMTRRSLIKAGFAGTAVAVAAGLPGVLPAHAVAATGVALDWLILSAAAAGTPRQQTLTRRPRAPVRALMLPRNGDVTALWTNHLHARWGSGAVAGLTPPHSLFCFAQLGASAFMRVIHRSPELDGLVAWVMVPPGLDAMRYPAIIQEIGLS